MPFHYGTPDGQGRARAANELTVWEMDPASKQPRLKQAAVRLEKDGSGVGTEATSNAMVSATMPTAKPEATERTHVADHLDLLINSLDLLAHGFQVLRERYAAEPGVDANALLFRTWSEEARGTLQPFVIAHGAQRDGDGKDPQPAPPTARSGRPSGLLRDLQDLWLATKQSLILTIALDQAAQALRDEAFGAALSRSRAYNEREGEWLLTRIKQAAPQTLTVPS